MLTLWGRVTSSNVMKVLWLLDELGLAYERIDAGGEFGRTGTPEFRARSPLGFVPMLEDDGFALFESNAILRYLCRAHAPETPLYPDDARERGTVEAWMEFQQTALGPPAGRLYMSVVRTPAEQRDHGAIASAIHAAAAMWAVVDARLAERPYVCGPSLTLADMALGPHVHRWFAMPIARPDAPHLRVWYERLLQRPAYGLRCAQKPS